MSSKTEVKAKVPVTAPQDKSSRDTRKANKPGPKSEVCRFFLKNECSRGSNCAFLHMKPSESSSNKYAPGKRKSHVQGPGEGIPQKPEVCRKFIQGTCRRGSGCRYYHPSVEEMRGSQEERVAWFALCPDIMSDFCNNPQCSFFHITQQDEDMYRNGGEISPELVDQAVHMSLAGNFTLIGALPHCKDYMRGLCNMQNCQLRHLNEGEYKDEVFYALLEEFHQKYGPPESQPFSVPVNNYHEPQEDFHNSMHGPSSQMMSSYPENMMSTDVDSSIFMRPYHDQAPERKRMRYQHEDPGYSGEDTRYDNPVDYEWERAQLPMDRESLMNQVIALQKETVNMRREHETNTRDLRERVSRLEEENSKLREDAIEVQVSHRVEMKTLTATNTTLVEDRRKAQEAVVHLQQENKELHQAVDSKVKVTTSELQKRLMSAEMQADKVRESFTKLNSMLKESENKRSKLVVEIGNLRSKLQERQARVPSGKDVQHLDSNAGYIGRDGYSRDVDLQDYSTQEQWSAHMESNRTNESYLRKPQRSRNMEIPTVTGTLRSYETVERKGSRSHYSTSTRYREDWQ